MGTTGATSGPTDQRIDVAQFYHVNFMRGQEQRLSSIKRKVIIYLMRASELFIK